MFYKRRKSQSTSILVQNLYSVRSIFLEEAEAIARPSEKDRIDECLEEYFDTHDVTEDDLRNIMSKVFRIPFEYRDEEEVLKVIDPQDILSMQAWWLPKEISTAVERLDDMSRYFLNSLASEVYQLTFKMPNAFSQMGEFNSNKKTNKRDEPDVSDEFDEFDESSEFDASDYSGESDEMTGVVEQGASIKPI